LRLGLPLKKVIPIGDETPREWAAAGLREEAVRRLAALPADEADERRRRKTGKSQSQ
jgi:hypothetical protein